MTLSGMIYDALYVWFDYRSVYLGKKKKGVYYPVFSVKVFFAEKVETSFHQRYRHKNTDPNERATKIGIARSTEKRWKQINKTGSGATEWFALTPQEVAQVKVELFLLSITSWLKIIVGLFFFLFLLYCTAVGLVVLTDEYGLKLIKLCTNFLFS